MEFMKIIVGLGNPGEKYKKNRHNTGFMVVDKLAQKLGAPIWKYKKNFKADIVQAKSHKGETFLLVKPQTFMNNSGEAVQAVWQYFSKEIEENKKNSSVDSALYIIYDDLDLVLGNHKTQLGRGPKVHNGLLSIYQYLKNKKFWHVRMGVDSREGSRDMPGSSYLLQNFSVEERQKLDLVVEQVAKILLS